MAGNRDRATSCVSTRRDGRGRNSRRGRSRRAGSMPAFMPIPPIPRTAGARFGDNHARNCPRVRSNERSRASNEGCGNVGRSDAEAGAVAVVEAVHPLRTPRRVEPRGPGRLPHRPLRDLPDLLVAGVVVPGEQPALRAPDVGRLGQLPEAGAGSGLHRRDPTHADLHVALRPAVDDGRAARRRGLEPEDRDARLLPDGGLRDLGHLHDLDGHHVLVADGPDVRPHQRRPPLVRHRPAAVPLQHEGGALRHRGDGRVGLARVHRDHLPRRAAGRPAGAVRGGGDRRREPVEHVPERHVPAPRTGDALPRHLALDQRAPALRRGLPDDQGWAAVRDHGHRLLPVPQDVRAVRRRTRCGGRMGAVPRDPRLLARSSSGSGSGRCTTTHERASHPGVAGADPHGGATPETAMAAVQQMAPPPVPTVDR